jgi:Domain of unknown function (DUF4091)
MRVVLAGLWLKRAPSESARQIVAPGDSAGLVQSETHSETGFRNPGSEIYSLYRTGTKDRAGQLTTVGVVVVPNQHGLGVLRWATGPDVRGVTILTKKIPTLRSYIKVAIPVVCALVSVGASMSYAQSVWVVGSMPRIGQFDAPATASSISLYAAKGEAESLQVVVGAPASGLSQVNLTASDLTGPGGATISKQNLTFYREYYVYVGQSSPDFGVGNRPIGVGWYPDGLIPFKDPATGLDLTGAILDAVPYNIPGDQNQPFWVDINVPRSAVAGTYTGTITVTSSQGSWTVGVNLQVWNFTLPVASRLKSNFGFHGNEGTLVNNQVLLQHRIQPFTFAASELLTLQAYGAEIVGLPYFNQSSGCTINAPPTVANLASSMSAYPGFPSYVYPADEVTGCANLQQNLQAWAQATHAAGTKMLVTVVPDPTLLNDGTGTGRSDVDIWVIMPKQYCANLNLIPCVVTPSVPIVQAKGDEVWSYTALEQDYYSPKWLLDFAPINYRISPGFMNQQFGFKGMLYSFVTRWNSDPWNRANSDVTGGFPGEDLLVYPGQQVGLSSVQPSMRLKYLRDGVDDYDYMAMLKDQGQGALVQQVLASIAPDWHNWTKDPVALENARIQFGQKLDQLAGGSTLQALPPDWQLAITVMKGAAGTDRVNFWQWAWYWQRSPAFPGAPTGFGVFGSIDNTPGMIDKIIALGGGDGFRVISADQWIPYYRQAAQPPDPWQRAIIAMSTAAGTDSLNFWQWAWYWQRPPAFPGAPAGFGVLGSIDNTPGLIDKIIALGSRDGSQTVSAKQWVLYYRQALCAGCQDD